VKTTLKRLLNFAAPALASVAAMVRPILARFGYQRDTI
jgi:hypothetical protein